MLRGWLIQCDECLYRIRDCNGHNCELEDADVSPEHFCGYGRIISNGSIQNNEIPKAAAAFVDKGEKAVDEMSEDSQTPALFRDFIKQTNLSRVKAFVDVYWYENHSMDE